MNELETQAETHQTQTDRNFKYFDGYMKHYVTFKAPNRGDQPIKGLLVGRDNSQYLRYKVAHYDGFTWVSASEKIDSNYHIVDVIPGSRITRRLDHWDFLEPGDSILVAFGDIQNEVIPCVYEGIVPGASGDVTRQARYKVYCDGKFYYVGAGPDQYPDFILDITRYSAEIELDQVGESTEPVEIEQPAEPQEPVEQKSKLDGYVHLVCFGFYEDSKFVLYSDVDDPKAFPSPVPVRLRVDDILTMIPHIELELDGEQRKTTSVVYRDSSTGVVRTYVALGKFIQTLNFIKEHKAK